MRFTYCDCKWCGKRIIDADFCTKKCLQEYKRENGLRFHSKKYPSIDYSKMKLYEISNLRKRMLQVVHKLASILYREQAKRTACQRCGYNIITHICHIKPVSSFSLDSTPEEINSRSNICFLCPNCHYELDHKYLEILTNEDRPTFRVINNTTNIK
jgi:hypothetical protein